MKAINSLLIILLLSFSSCVNKQRTNTTVGLKEEDFNSFIKVFYSDSLFQISRIIFPITLEFSDTSRIVRNKGIWKMLRDTYFKQNDSIAIIDGEIYKRKLTVNKSQAQDYFYIENSGFFITIKFSLKEGKWYLSDYIESND